MSQMEIDRNGTKIWRNPHGQYHCEDGPAVEGTDGTKYWFINGRCHREDGPAIEFSNGKISWFIGGEQYSFDEWLNKLQISDKEKVMLCLKWK